MKSLIAAMCVVFLFAGCAQTHPVSKAYEGGRYSQFNLANVPLMQIDWPTPELCDTSVRNSPDRGPVAGTTVRCGRESRASSLLYPGMLENPLLRMRMRMRMNTHFSNEDLCRSTAASAPRGAVFTCGSHQ